MVCYLGDRQRTVRDRGPGRPRSRAIKANLVGRDSLDFLELQILVLCGNAHLTVASGCHGTVISHVARVLVLIRSGHDD